MAHVKQGSKRKRRKAALAIWGAAGTSLAMASGASAAIAPTENAPSRAVGLPPPVVTLHEEEISDISLATFYVFEKENFGQHALGEQVARACGRCGGGGRCGGAGRCGGGGRCAAARCAGARCAAGRCGVARCAGGCRCGCGVGVVACGGCSCSCCLSGGACQANC